SDRAGCCRAWPVRHRGSAEARMPSRRFRLTLEFPTRRFCRPEMTAEARPRLAITRRIAAAGETLPARWRSTRFERYDTPVPDVISPTEVPAKVSSGAALCARTLWDCDGGRLALGSLCYEVQHEHAQFFVRSSGDFRAIEC